MHNHINKHKSKSNEGKYSFADIFCGAGLFSAGMKSSGLKPALAIDLDGAAIASYNRNVARVAHQGSVTDTMPNLEVDALIAGPPCQGFSTLGRRDPADERNKLGMVVPKWAQQLKAKIVVIENVPRFVSSEIADELREELQKCGYSIQTFILNSEDFGTPQKRRRAFTVASKVGAVQEPRPTRKNYVSVRDVLLNKPFSHDDPMHKWPKPSDLALARFKTIPAGGDKRDVMNAIPDSCPQSWFEIGCQATDVWGRMHLDRPSNTLRCCFQNPSKGRYIHPVENRTISLREGARLQGIPDSWQMVGEAGQVARQIGNGVPVPMARAVGRVVKEALDSAAVKNCHQIAA